MSAPTTREHKGTARGRMAYLRAFNAVLSALMLALFLLHGVGNAFQLIGWGMPTSRTLAHVVVILAIVHAVLGAILTVQTVRAQREAAVSYVRLNSRFWAVRASGLAIAIFIVFHMLTFLQTSSGGPFRLNEFGTFEFTTNMGLVLSIALHVLANARPLLVSLGIGAPRARAADLVLVFSVLLLLMAVGFVVYFIRWSVM